MNEARIFTGEGIEHGERVRGPKGEFIARLGDGSKGYGIYRFVRPGILKRLGKYKEQKEAEVDYATLQS